MVIGLISEPVLEDLLVLVVFVAEEEESGSSIELSISELSSSEAKGSVQKESSPVSHPVSVYVW